MIRPYRFLSTEHFNPNAFAAAAIIEGVIGTTTVSGNGAWWKRTLANFATNGTILGDGSNGEMFIFMDLMLHYCTGFSKVDEKTGKTPIERTREVFGFNKIPLKDFYNVLTYVADNVDFFKENGEKFQNWVLEMVEYMKNIAAENKVESSDEEVGIFDTEDDELINAVITYLTLNGINIYDSGKDISNREIEEMYLKSDYIELTKTNSEYLYLPGTIKKVAPYDGDGERGYRIAQAYSNVMTRTLKLLDSNYPIYLMCGTTYNNYGGTNMRDLPNTIEKDLKVNKTSVEKLKKFITDYAAIIGEFDDVNAAKYFIGTFNRLSLSQNDCSIIYRGKYFTDKYIKICSILAHSSVAGELKNELKTAFNAIQNTIYYKLVSTTKENLDERIKYFTNEIFRTATLSTSPSGVTKVYNTIRTKLVTDRMVEKFVSSLLTEIMSNITYKKFLHYVQCDDKKAWVASHWNSGIEHSSTRTFVRADDYNFISDVFNVDATRAALAYIETFINNN